MDYSTTSGDGTASTGPERGLSVLARLVARRAMEEAASGVPEDGDESGDQGSATEPAGDQEDAA